MAKKSLVLYYDIRQPLEALTNAERGRLLMAVLDYAEMGVVPDFRGRLLVAFSFIRASLDRDAEKYEQMVEYRREAGRRGGYAKAEKQELASARFAKKNAAKLAKLADNVPVPVPDNDSVSVSVPVPVGQVVDDREMERLRRLRERIRQG